MRTAFNFPRKELLALHTETLFETINTSTGINQLLFAGIERVAFGTNFHADVFAGRTGMDYLAASARDRCVNVLGMNAFLQPMSPLLL